jgi:hypothetical protein
MTLGPQGCRNRLCRCICESCCTQRYVFGRFKNGFSERIRLIIVIASEFGNLVLSRPLSPDEIDLTLVPDHVLATGADLAIASKIYALVRCLTSEFSCILPRNNVERFPRREPSQPFPHSVNQGFPEPAPTNPGFLDPNLMNQHQSTQGQARSRTHSQGHSQGHSPGFNSNQGGANSGPANPGFMDPNLLNSGNNHSPQSILRHERSRTYSQGHSPGVSAGVPNPRSIQPNLHRARSNSQVHNSGFTDPNAMDSIRNRSMQENTRRVRTRSHSQGHHPSFNLNPVIIPNRGVVNPGFTYPNAADSRHHHHSTLHHERKRTHSHSHHRSHSHDRRPLIFSAPNRPFLTTTTHVKPLPIPSPNPSQQFHQSTPQHKMPPPDPRQISTSGIPGAKHDLLQFQYSMCTGKKKALCVGVFILSSSSYFTHLCPFRLA